MVKAGWRYESYRHSLAARGIQTSRYYARKRYMAEQQQVLMQEPKNESILSKISGGLSKVGSGLKRSEEAVVDRFKRPRPSIEVGKDVSGPSQTVDVVKEQESAKIVPGSGFAAGVGPKSAEERILAQERLKKTLTRLITEQRPVNVAVANIEKMRFNTPVEIVGEDGKVESVTPLQLLERTSGAQHLQLQEALQAEAVKMAQAGIPVPREVYNVLDSTARSRVKNIETTYAREHEGQLSRAARSAAESAAIAAAEAPFSVTKAGLEASKEGYAETGEGSMLIPNIQKLGQSQFFQTNAFTGDHSDGDGLTPISDAFNISPSLPSKLDSGLGKIPGKAGENVVAKDILKKVDSLYDARSQLADVDMSGYEKGAKAFEKGDREELVKAIGDLTAESKKLKDRHKLVEDVRMRLQSTPDVAFAGSGDGFLSFGGGSTIADKTNKMNEVKKEIQKKSQDVVDRGRILQYKLQRLNASMKPEYGAPRKIERFPEDNHPQAIPTEVSETLKHPFRTAKETLNKLNELDIKRRNEWVWNESGPKAVKPFLDDVPESERYKYMARKR